MRRKANKVTYFLLILSELVPLQLETENITVNFGRYMGLGG